MRLFFSALLFGSVVPLAAFAQATPTSLANTPHLQVTRPIYAWKTEFDHDKKTGAFNHCLVKNMFDNGTVLMVAQNHDGVKRLALNFPQPKMTAGEQFDLTAQVDKRDVFPVEAVAVSPQILTIGIPDTLPDQMRKGQALYLRGPNDEVVYTLDGMDGAVTALQDCITTQKGGKSNLHIADTRQQNPAITKPKTSEPTQAKDVKEPVAIASAEAAPANDKDKAKKSATATPKAVTPPVASQPAATPSVAKETASASTRDRPRPGDEPTATVATAAAPSAAATALQKIGQSLSNEKSIEVMAEGVPPQSLPPALDAIFKAARLQPAAFITTPEKNKTSKRPLDYAWIKGDLFIGVKEQNAIPKAGLEAAAMYYLRLLKQRCTGTFIAESGTPVTIRPATANAVHYLAVEAACSPGTRDDSIAALLFTTDKQNLRIYFVESPAAKGADAIKGRDAILNVLKNSK